MKATRKFDAVTTLGSYEDKDGNTKYNYHQVGIVIENEKGQLSLKLNSLPLPNEKGEVWVNFYPIEKEDK